MFLEFFNFLNCYENEDMMDLYNDIFFVVIFIYEY